MKIITKSIVAAVLLSGGAMGLLAQSNPAPDCPLGHPRGYGRTLTPEQRATQQAAVQELVAELRVKREAGVITQEELIWLQQVERRGGQCLTGTPRGPGAGRGQGYGKGRGGRRGPGAGHRAHQGQRRGLRDGTGPRSQTGECPLGTTPQRRGGR